MTPYAWTLLALYVVLGGIGLAATFSRTLQDRALARRARSLGLTLPDSLTGARRRASLRARGALVGGLVAVPLTLMLLSATSVESTSESFLIIGMVFVGMAAGAAVTSAVHATRPRPDTVRVARAEAVELKDYVAGIERNGARVVVTAAVAIQVVVFSALLSGATAIEKTGAQLGGIIVTVLAVASLLMFEVVGRKIIREPQPVGSPAELAWSDAHRSSLARDLVTAPLALGLYGSVIGLIDLSAGLAVGSASATANAVMTVAVTIAAIGFLAILAFVLASKPQRHFLRRLWPDVAAAENKR